jgi:uncharacterized protein YcbK (DUF882 family)
VSRVVGDLSPHFSEHEFVCPHCHGGFPRPSLVHLLEAIRGWAQQPVTILSGYRCPIHNASVGGAVHSQHVLGSASDLRVPGLTLERAWSFGAVGVGLRNGLAVHVDVRDGPRVSWRY